jgi:uncharacterized protein (UPF0332 family)
MTYEELLDKGLIKRIKPSPSQVKGDKLQDDIYIFDKMRSKRHRVIYDVSGLVSQQEARQAFEFAMKFVKTVESLLQQIVHEE